MIYVYIAIAKDCKPVIDYLFIYICTYMFIILNLYTYFSACYIGTIFAHFLVQ